MVPLCVVAGGVKVTVVLLCVMAGGVKVKADSGSPGPGELSCKNKSIVDATC